MLKIGEQCNFKGLSRFLTFWSGLNLQTGEWPEAGRQTRAQRAQPSKECPDCSRHSHAGTIALRSAGVTYSKYFSCASLMPDSSREATKRTSIKHWATVVCMRMHWCSQVSSSMQWHQGQNPHCSNTLLWPDRGNPFFLALEINRLRFFWRESCNLYLLVATQITFWNSHAF